jgi:hypothetical protein
MEFSGPPTREHDESEVVAEPAPAEGHPSVGERLRQRWDRTVANMGIESFLTFAIVTAAAGYVLASMHPSLLLTNTTPTGGDMGAHVWGPAYLRDELIPNGRLTGWTPDWYTGFPAYHFYMLIPSLLIVALDVILPYGIAFKLVSVSGLVSLPIACWAFGRLSGWRFPGPALAAMFSVLFLYDRSYRIWGGNAASTMAGEFAYSMSLSLAVLFIGVVVRGVRTGKHQWLAAVLLALVGLTHIIPAFFAIGVASIVVISRTFGRWSVRGTEVSGGGAWAWGVPVAIVGGLLGAFWVLPFFLRQDFLNDMGWERTDEYFVWLVPNSNMQWMQILALAGVILAVALRRRVAVILALSAVVNGALFTVIPQTRLWNSRILPFYYVLIALLAAYGVSLALRSISGEGSVLFRSNGETRRMWAVGLLALPFLLAWVAVIDTRFDFGLIENVASAWPRNSEVVDGPICAAVTPDPEVTSTTMCVTEEASATAVADEATRVRALRDNGAELATRIGLAGLLLIGIELVRSWVLLRKRNEYRLPVVAPVRQVGAVIAALAVLAITEIPMNLTDFGTREGRAQLNDNDEEETVNYNSWSFGPLEVSAADHFVDGWSRWNYKGYERKDAYPEYEAVVSMMAEVGETTGCGRTMWEYKKDLDRFGTPMALMLLPFWTEGCIGSMEGLYFEASATTPYHFMLQTELSEKPSQAQRHMPYTRFDIDAGVTSLQRMGVRYYLAHTETAVSAANGHGELTLVNSVGDWHVYEVANAPLVEPLSANPVVLDGISDHNDEWLEPALGYYLQQDAPMPLAADGPDNWVRVNTEDVVEIADRYDPDVHAHRSRYVSGLDLETLAQAADGASPLPEIAVSDIQTTNDRISFSVSEVGVPVVVKASYFPNWKASGADGPYRIAPNMMVVIPTDTEVTLNYGWTGADIGGIVLTLLGAVLLVPLVWLQRRNGFMLADWVEEEPEQMVLVPGVRPRDDYNEAPLVPHDPRPGSGGDGEGDGNRDADGGDADPVHRSPVVGEPALLGPAADANAVSGEIASVEPASVEPASVEPAGVEPDEAAEGGVAETPEPHVDAAVAEVPTPAEIAGVGFTVDAPVGLPDAGEVRLVERSSGAAAEPGESNGVAGGGRLIPLEAHHESAAAEPPRSEDPHRADESVEPEPPETA